MNRTRSRLFPSMKLEERVTVLCAQALAADDDSEVRKILAELRLVLHQHIEQLREGLIAAYSNSMVRTPSASDVWWRRTHLSASPAIPLDSDKPARTWRQVVHEIASEQDHAKALQLSQELSRLLQRQSEATGPN